MKKQLRLTGNGNSMITRQDLLRFRLKGSEREGAVIVDVGITRIADDTKKTGYRLLGDVDFETVAPKASYITPVPGGVGPMTIVSLMVNTLKAAENKKRK